MAKTVLVVDDDFRIRDLLRMYLEKSGLQVTESENGLDALLSFQQGAPDIVILDGMMPVLDGWETCRQMRKIASTPIIMLTARVEETDKLLSFESGADDYVGKPFNPAEVVARVRAILRRSSGVGNNEQLQKSIPMQTFCRMEIDVQSHTVKINGAEIELTTKEFDLLCLLAKHPNRTFTREQLLEAVWGFNNEGDTRTVDVHMQRLRKKIDNGACPDWQIATVWGIGYRFETSIAPKKETFSRIAR